MVDGRELGPHPLLHPPEKAYHALHVVLVEVADVEVLQQRHEQPEPELGVAAHVVEVVADAEENRRRDHVHPLDVPHLRTQVRVPPQHPLDRVQVLAALGHRQVRRDLRPADVLGNLVLVRGRGGRQPLEVDRAGEAAPLQLDEEAVPDFAATGELTSAGIWSWSGGCS